VYKCHKTHCPASFSTRLMSFYFQIQHVKAKRQKQQDQSNSKVETRRENDTRKERRMFFNTFSLLSFLFFYFPFVSLSSSSC